MLRMLFSSLLLAAHGLHSIIDSVYRIVEGRPRSHQRDTAVVVGLCALLAAAILS